MYITSSLILLLRWNRNSDNSIRNSQKISSISYWYVSYNFCFWRALKSTISIELAASPFLVIFDFESFNNILLPRNTAYTSNYYTTYTKMNSCCFAVKPPSSSIYWFIFSSSVGYHIKSFIKKCMKPGVMTALYLYLIIYRILNL